MCLLSLVSAIYVKQNPTLTTKSLSSSHCVLNGKDGDKNVRNKPCLKSYRNGWSSSTTNTIMNEKLTQGRDHGWVYDVVGGKCDSTSNV